MSEVLYRKYRSQKFSDLIGQDIITRVLSSSVKNNVVGHAYIFSGPRGTGKTSTARILAKAVNCSKLEDGEPCGKCSSCRNITAGRSVDIIEIDAASHTGVDDVRSIIEKIEFAPVRLKKKVYIIDEVHMLSTAAFNALLKTLEEPPAHALFILATTEIHKVPITVLSRCQRFDFKLASEENLIIALEKITKNEKVSIGKKALSYVAKVGSGSYRDAIMALDTVLSSRDAVADKKVTEQEVKSILGLPDDKKVNLFIKSILKNDINEALEIIDEFVNNGGDVKLFCSQNLDKLRDILLDKVRKRVSKEYEEASLARIMELIKSLTSAMRLIPVADIKHLPLEIAVLEITNAADLEGECFSKQPHKVLNSKNKVSGIINSSSITSVSGKEKIFNNDSNENLGDENFIPSVSIEELKGSWGDFIEEVKPFNNHLYAFLSKSSIIGIDNGIVKISVPYEFYKESIEEAKSADVLCQICSKVFSCPLKIKCVVDELKKKDKKSEEDIVKEAVEIFSEDII